jgi:hypothetical protein
MPQANAMTMLILMLVVVALFVISGVLMSRTPRRAVSFLLLVLGLCGAGGALIALNVDNYDPVMGRLDDARMGDPGTARMA